MTQNKSTAPIWIITEGIAGTENQCIGVAESLCRGMDTSAALSFDVKRIGLREPWLTLSPYLGFEQNWSFTEPLSPPWPRLLITCGRKAIAASRYIKRQSQGRTITVHIQDPRISATHFDLVAVPRHDPMRGINVIVTAASPNRITIPRIEREVTRFPHLRALPHPRIAVLIGGTSKAYQMTQDITERLAEQLSCVKGGLMVTCSRRTGDKNRAILETSLNKATNYFWNGTGDNPYFAFLGLADFILVTADSASMISEACSTGKPVYMIDLDGGAKRIDKLHRYLIDEGCLRRFDGRLSMYDYTPLNDAKLVADAVKARFGALLKGDDA